MSFLHQHPYPPFVPEQAEKMIVGTIPPPRFSTGELFQEDVDFCYGSKFGLLWRIIQRLFQCDLDFENTAKAIEQRKQLLTRNRIGICDMVESCRRERMDASDLGMKNVVLRNLPEVLETYPSVKRVLFMGGNSKNGPEYLFQKQIKAMGIPMNLTSKGSPRIHELELADRRVECVTLISPSSAANRSIGGHSLYKKMKALNPSYSTLDFRVSQFAPFF